jgi:hypothetical protein
MAVSSTSVNEAKGREISSHSAIIGAGALGSVRTEDFLIRVARPLQGQVKPKMRGLNMGCVGRRSLTILALALASAVCSAQEFSADVVYADVAKQQDAESHGPATPTPPAAKLYVSKEKMRGVARRHRYSDDR